MQVGATTRQHGIFIFIWQRLDGGGAGQGLAAEEEQTLSLPALRFSKALGS